MKHIKTSHPSHAVAMRLPQNIFNEGPHLSEPAFQTTSPEKKLYILRNVNILENIIFSFWRFRFYPHPGRFYPALSLKQLAKYLLFFFKPYKIIKKGIWITDGRSPDYFHWWLNGMTKWITSQAHAEDYTVLLPDYYKEIFYIRESLEMLNVNVYYYDVKKRVRVKELLVPRSEALSGSYNKQVVTQFRQRFISAPVVPHKKIYLARQKERIEVTNEVEVINTFKRFGFEIHFFETYNFRTQVEIMANTKCLAGLHNGGLTNMLFMPGGGSVLEIKSGDDSMNDCFFELSSDLDQHYYYLHADSRDLMSKGVVSININRLEQVLVMMEQMI